MDLWFWWVIFAILLFIGEILTSGFFLLWIGAGALLAGLLAALSLPVPVQLIGFIVSSAGLTVSSRTIFKKLFGNRLKMPMVSSNIDALIDTTGVVIKEIDNDSGGGLVKLNGEDWTAISESDQRISKGKRVLVLRVEGVKLIVVEKL